MYSVHFLQTHPFAFQRKVGLNRLVSGERQGGNTSNCQRVFKFKTTVMNSLIKNKNKKHKAIKWSLSLLLS